MGKEEKLFDEILTTGARWMAFYKNNLINKDGLGLKDIKLNKTTYGFLAIARVYNTYGGDFFVDTNIFKYWYLKYIKGFKFLQRVNGNLVDYIDINIFLSELVTQYGEQVKIIETIYNTYYRR